MSRPAASAPSSFLVFGTAVLLAIATASATSKATNATYAPYVWNSSNTTYAPYATNSSNGSSWYNNASCLAPANGTNATNATNVTQIVCSGRGYCHFSHCHCDGGFYGSQCQYAFARTYAPSAWWNGTNTTNGTWPNNTASCYGPANATNGTRVACSGRGYCYSYGYCGCNSGFYGAQCQYAMNYTCPTGNVSGNNTPVACSGRGTCHYSHCHCQNGFYGVACEARWSCGWSGNITNAPSSTNGTVSNATVSGCGSHGYCVYGRCSCDYGYHGSHCQHRATACPTSSNMTNGSSAATNGTSNATGVACSGRGYCWYGRCNCNDGFYGAACQYLGGDGYPHNGSVWNYTHGNGWWNNGTNGTASNSSTCSNRGYEAYGRCRCVYGYIGSHCQYRGTTTGNWTNTNGTQQGNNSGSQGTGAVAHGDAASKKTDGDSSDSSNAAKYGIYAAAAAGGCALLAAGVVLGRRFARGPAATAPVTAADVTEEDMDCRGCEAVTPKAREPMEDGDDEGYTATAARGEPAVGVPVAFDPADKASVYEPPMPLHSKADLDIV